MINITEQTPHKLPGLSSFKVTFNYNPELVQLVKSCGNSVWDPKAKEWEVGLPYLAKFIDGACNVDDIQLSLLPDREEVASYSGKLMQYRTTPYKYQEEGIRYGLSHDKFLLLDAPGLGKTLQMIYLAEEHKKRHGVSHCLIVCGINTLKTNWKKEIERHSSEKCHILGERISKKGKVTYGGVKERLKDLESTIDEFFVITNIETLRDKEIIELINKGKFNKFDMIILDECHKVKNPSAAQSQGFMKLTKAKYRVGLTGTLLLNSPLDAAVALKWLDIDKATYTNFKYFYCTYTGMYNNIFVGYKNIPVLKQELDAYSLRRTKDILDLPPKNIINELVEMDSVQETFYKNIVNGIVDQVDKVELTTTNLLAMTARLRQATASPSMLTTENIPSAKIDRCCDLVDEIVDNGDKVVVFSVFKETLNVLADRLSMYNPLVCTGDVKDSDVSEHVDKFQNNDENKVILATTQKMGTGITLTRARYCIFIDTPWTAADLEQAQDRIHRIGSSEPVFIYQLWTKDTFDEHVKEIVENKALVSDYVIDGKCPPALSSKLKELILDLKGEN